MPRIVYTMACDGLLFQPFSAVLPKLKTPWVASLVTGIIGGKNRLRRLIWDQIEFYIIFQLFKEFFRLYLT